MKDCINESKLLMEELNTPFETRHIEWRVQSASKRGNNLKVLVLPYLTARSVMQRLDDVCGGFWQSNYDKIQTTGTEAFQCRLSIKIGDEWITRTDAAEVSDIESVKGGHSNALKRAGVQWGIGRYLYDLEPFWVELKNQGQINVYGKFKINGQLEQVKGYFNPPKLPSWALPKSESKFGSEQHSVAAQTQSNPTSTKKETSSQQENGPKSQPSNGKQSHANSVALIIKVLTEMQMPENYVAPLLKITTGATVHFSQATSEELGKFYHALIPVKTYLDTCRSLNLNEEQILYYAQIVHKTELKNPFSLIAKMTKNSCTKTLELIREDLKIGLAV